MRDPRGSRAWTKLASQVVHEEPLCWLRMNGCTTISTTADHVIPVVDRPDLAMVRENLRGAYKHCNSSRGRRPVTRESTQPALGFFV